MKSLGGGKKDKEGDKAVFLVEYCAN